MSSSFPARQWKESGICFFLCVKLRTDDSGVVRTSSRILNRMEQSSDSDSDCTLPSPIFSSEKRLHWTVEFTWNVQNWCAPITSYLLGSLVVGNAFQFRWKLAFVNFLLKLNEIFFHLSSTCCMAKREMTVQNVA